MQNSYCHTLARAAAPRAKPDPPVDTPRAQGDLNPAASRMIFPKLALCVVVCLCVLLYTMSWCVCVYYCGLLLVCLEDAGFRAFYSILLLRRQIVALYHPVPTKLNINVTSCIQTWRCLHVTKFWGNKMLQAPIAALCAFLQHPTCAVLPAVQAKEQTTRNDRKQKNSFMDPHRCAHKVHCNILLCFLWAYDFTHQHTSQAAHCCDQRRVSSDHSRLPKKETTVNPWCFARVRLKWRVSCKYVCIYVYVYMYNIYMHIHTQTWTTASAAVARGRTASLRTVDGAMTRTSAAMP